MKAIICTKYGLIDALELKEVENPTPKDDEVLIKIHAASVNQADLSFITGKPLVVRMMDGGLLKPRYTIPGGDIAGRVEAVGRNVKQFRSGDAIFGDLSDCGRGGFAEYVCVPENEIALKPTNISFEEAAAVPQAAFVALEGLRKGNIQEELISSPLQSGKKVLIYGASGGIGTFAVQLARYYGAEVTGVCSTKNLEMVRSIGANHVIDYTKEDFTTNGMKYDMILATAGYRSIFDFKRALSPNGTYVASGGSMTQILQSLLIGPWISNAGSKEMGGLMVKTNTALPFLKALIEGDRIKPVIDRCFNFREAAKALRYYGKGHAKGKVVITMAHK